MEYSILDIAEFAVRIGRGYLPLEFAAETCRENLLHEFTVTILQYVFLYL